MKSNKNISVFASGNGSNFINIYRKIERGYINGNLVLLISNNPTCGAVDFAKTNNINYKIINDFRYGKTKNSEYDLALKFCKTDLILLAGFMKKIPLNIINNYPNKIINIHPSLLPKFGGKGFYGMKVHEAAIKSKDKFSGPTVHFVNKKYDCGLIIKQKKIKISNNDTSIILSKKVLKAEHEIYAEVVRAYCLDKIEIIKNKVIISE